MPTNPESTGPRGILRLPTTLLWVLLSASVILLGAATGYALHGVGVDGGAVFGGHRVVTLDAVRLVNSERAAVAGMLGSSAAKGSIALRMLHIGRTVRAAVREVAGPGTVVLVKQAVVSGPVTDITTKVLARLGLPLHAPTINISRYLNPAPTSDDLAGFGAKLRARNSRLSASARAAAHSQSEAKGLHAAKEVLP